MRVIAGRADLSYLTDDCCLFRLQWRVWWDDPIFVGHLLSPISVWCSRRHVKGEKAIVNIARRIVLIKRIKASHDVLPRDGKVGVSRKINWDVNNNNNNRRVIPVCCAKPS